jgi:hypothetical protein
LIPNKRLTIYYQKFPEHHEDFFQKLFCSCDITANQIEMVKKKKRKKWKAYPEKKAEKQ